MTKKLPGKIISARAGRAKTAAPIKAVVFDFGGVLVEDAEIDLEKKYGFKRKPAAEQLRYKTILDRVERGNGTVPQLYKVMKEVLSYPGSPLEIKNTIVTTAIIKSGWQLLQELRGKYTVAILTNNKKSFPQQSAKHLGISLKGIRIFNSAYIGMRKPEPGIYDYLLRQLKLPPNQVVFIDDKKRNVVAAKALGIHAFTFTDNTAKLRTALKKLGVEVRI